MRTKAPSTQLGFTLIEVMMTVAILGVVTTLAASSFARSSNRANIHSAGMMLKSRIENTRGLAVATGSRFASDRLIADQSCTVRGNGLFMLIDQAEGKYNVPTQVVIEENGSARVFCETFELERDSNRHAEFSPGSSRLAFSFTPTGRLVGTDGRPTEIFLAVRDRDNELENYGFRILGSGVLCRASSPARGSCDMDQE